MNRTGIIDLIFSLSKNQTGFESLEARFSSIGKAELLTMILECGVMPEVFHHDSSEEKLWAKYSDILLAKSLESLGFKSQVLRVRGDSADVFAESDKYKIVGDAKTFRLSRTAKNQKDFKVEALDSWRRTSDYALLAGPFLSVPQSVQCDLSAGNHEECDTAFLFSSFFHAEILFNKSQYRTAVESWQYNSTAKRTRRFEVGTKLLELD